MCFLKYYPLIQEFDGFEQIKLLKDCFWLFQASIVKMNCEMNEAHDYF